MLAVSRPANLSIGVALLAIHLELHPLVLHHGLVHVRPFEAHAFQHHAQRGRRAGTRVFLGNEHAVCGVVVASLHRVLATARECAHILRRPGNAREVLLLLDL